MGISKKNIEADLLLLQIKQEKIKSLLLKKEYDSAIIVQEQMKEVLKKISWDTRRLKIIEEMQKKGQREDFETKTIEYC